jgi:hypothetical protein
MLCYFYASTFVTRVIIKSCFMVVCTLIVRVDNGKLYDTITTYMININQVEIIFHGLIGSYTSLYWRFWISSTSVRNSVFSRVERSGTSGKTLNFSHEWKKSQIFNKDECKYLFLPFQLKNKACRFHSFIRMLMSCLLHKILQRHVQCSKYTLI